MSDYGQLRDQLSKKDKELDALRKANEALKARVDELEKIAAPIEAVKRDFDKLETKAKGWFK